MKTRRSRLAAATLACIAPLAAWTAGAQTLGRNATGFHDGYYYTFWKDSGDATMTLLPGGRYASRWNRSTHNWVGGKGWNPGGPRVVEYAGHYGVDETRNSYLALYGWTRDPLVEYYVVESYGSYNPATCDGGEDFGSFRSDGATYRVRRCLRVDAPSIEGNSSTFHQYFSVREPKKGFGEVSGTITVGNHFDYWASRGLVLGRHDYMVMATEGYQSEGSSDISVREVQPPAARRRNGSHPLAPAHASSMAPAAQAAPPPAPAAAGAAPAPAPAATPAPASAPRIQAIAPSPVVELWTRLRGWWDGTRDAEASARRD
ncbi:glycoside hydrolase family 11 protein [Luteimonas sp. J29]|jgi:hypothetical protein|uniref:glycoside hydrolase family 11 protein n=1 Tax=Luteimonas sp. J29 TaxID=935863 RepID=UPI0004B77A31|nr:glycoside hydrolase family 11 protein [Luteimonas sp. J29]